jgi:outer membrane protein OmpA-like peptidoglycan-associated protein
MIKKLGLFVISAALAMPAFAGPGAKDGKTVAPKEENIGVGSGAAIGAIAGGPLGMIAGAALGGWLGGRFHKERTARIESQRKLAAAKADANALAQRLDGSESRAARLQSKLQAEQHDYDAMLQRALDAEILFPTGQSSLNRQAKERVTRLAQLIKQRDGLVVVVDGYADARGTAEYNEQLSAARAASVRDALIGAGVPAERITTRAEGEQEATAGVHDVDALALERRVHVTLVAPRAEGRVAQD